MWTVPLYKQHEQQGASTRSQTWLVVMNVKVACVLAVCLLALAITSTQAGIPRCCVKTAKFIPRRLLLKVHKWNVQLSSGACDISALVLHVRGMTAPICADPKIKRHLRMLQWKMKQDKESY
ncbi:C-C motif chemokine 27a [Thalassophryne amazonica]|uniref:C-C motif chemokine 27a n=1 Tax=Thalassophryne amazonica TaxID=390379 RepID=UPI0014718207|nr:C-C motif chemokine 27a [Thalassophryne amazonica]